MSEVQTVQVIIQVPKESKEVVDAVVGLVGDIKAGKSITEIAGDALPKIIAAVDGFQAIGDEVKSASKEDLAAYLVKELLLALGV